MIKSDKPIPAINQFSFSQSLYQRLRLELTGDFKHAILYSFEDKAHIDAHSLYLAFSGLSVDNQMIIDVLCTATRKEIAEIKEVYQHGE